MRRLRTALRRFTKTELSSDELRTQSQKLDREVQRLRASASTAEQWTAVDQLQTAGRYLWSAAAWLDRHVERVGP